MVTQDVEFAQVNPTTIGVDLHIAVINLDLEKQLVLDLLVLQQMLGNFSLVAHQRLSVAVHERTKHIDILLMLLLLEKHPNKLPNDLLLDFPFKDHLVVVYQLCECRLGPTLVIVVGVHGMHHE